MSDDLIRRSDAIKHCEIWRDRAKEAKDKEGWWMADNLLRLMKDAPTAEPKRGEWEEKETFHNADDNPIIEEWQSARCSVCGKYHTTPYMYYFNEYNFCPNCGADMREREDE